MTELFVSMAVANSFLHDWCDVAGDIGGYLGLLIGGSALTIIEIVDLVFYNALLKFIGKA